MIFSKSEEKSMRYDRMHRQLVIQKENHKTIVVIALYCCSSFVQIEIRKHLPNEVLFSSISLYSSLFLLFIPLFFSPLLPPLLSYCPLLSYSPRLSSFLPFSSLFYSSLLGIGGSVQVKVHRDSIVEDAFLGLRQAGARLKVCIYICILRSIIMSNMQTSKESEERKEVVKKM